MVTCIPGACPRQASRATDDSAAWREEPAIFTSDYDDDDDQYQHHYQRQRQHEHPHERHRPQGYRSSTVMALGNSCFGSLEYPRELPARVHMVGIGIGIGNGIFCVFRFPHGSNAAVCMYNSTPRCLLRVKIICRCWCVLPPANKADLIYHDLSYHIIPYHPQRRSVP